MNGYSFAVILLLSVISMSVDGKHIDRRKVCDKYNDLQEAVGECMGWDAMLVMTGENGATLSQQLKQICSFRQTGMKCAFDKLKTKCKNTDDVAKILAATGGICIESGVNSKYKSLLMGYDNDTVRMNYNDCIMPMLMASRPFCRDIYAGTDPNGLDFQNGTEAAKTMAENILRCDIDFFKSEPPNGCNNMHVERLYYAFFTMNLWAPHVIGGAVPVSVLSNILQEQA